MKLEPDSSGVCSIDGTREITSKPANPASMNMYRAAQPSMFSSPLVASSRVRRLLSGALVRRECRVDNPALTGQQAAGNDIVIGVDVQRPALAVPGLIVNEQLQKVVNIARIHLRGVQRGAAGQVGGAGNDDAIVNDGFARTGQGAVAAGFSGQVDNHRSEEHTSELQSRGHPVCRLLLEKTND